jgi:hypothetical protein
MCLQIGGKSVKDINNNGISGAILTLSGNISSICTTNLVGYYEFIGLPFGNYLININKIGYAFDLSSKTYNGLFLDYDNQNFIGVSIVKDNLNTVIVYPNPGKNAMTFTNLSAIATIKIFTVSGELVKTIEEIDGDGQTIWYADNDSGEKVASGVYLYVVINPQGEKKTGKVALVR